IADAAHALKDARQIGQATTLMPSLCVTSLTYILCGDYPAAAANSDEALAVAEEKNAALWKAWATLTKGWVLAQTEQSWLAAETMAVGISDLRSTGTTVLMPLWLS